MNKIYNIIGIIVSCSIIIYGIIFFTDIGAYIISESAFGSDMNVNMLMQMQQINANVIKINNSIHRGLGILISAIGFVSTSYFINNLKNKK